MAALSRALFLAFFICAIQTSQAGLLPSFDDLTSAAKTLEDTTLGKLNATIQNAQDAATALGSHLVSGLQSTINAAEDEVTSLINAAEADGIAAADCGIAATANLTRINVALPVSLTHCSVDYLDAFNYYINNVKDDFSQIFQNIWNGTKQTTECSLLNVPCYWNVFYSVTKTNLVKEGDVAFQVVNAQTAGVNLVATITKCYEEKSTQAGLDVAKVVPDTVRCIAQKKAEVSAAQS